MSDGSQAKTLVEQIADPLTIEQFKRALPERVKKSVNPQLIHQINKTLSEPEMFEQYRENLVSYASIMADGRFKISSYIDAVKYTSFKLMGKTNLDAYSATFPDRIQRFTTQGVASKDIASYVTSYNKSKLVGLIMEQSIIPSWVLNQDLYQQALNTQAELMLTARSEKVRSDAANSLLTQLKAPEVAKVELNVHQKEDSTVDQLRKATLELVAQQRTAIKAGQISAEEAAHSTLIIEGHAEEVE